MSSIRFALPFIAASAVVFAVPAEANEGSPVCAVNDPSGTPLNIRSKPGSKVVATAKNGEKFNQADEAEYKGKRWLHLTPYSKATERLGWGEAWVALSLLDCPKEPAAGSYGGELKCMTATGINARITVAEEPFGPVIGDINYGTEVAIIEVVNTKTMPFAKIYKPLSDSAVGWAFAEYLDCETKGN